MIRILLPLLLLVTAFTASASGREKPVETLTYKVVYRWGIVNKQAGRATFSLFRNPDGMSTAIMCARTEPWADRFYTVRDTLISTFSSSTFLPVKYRRIAHEGKHYANDVVTFRRSGNTTSAHCVRIRKKNNDKSPSVTETDLSANGDAVDLLSSFYYLRALDFDSMKKGSVRTIYIFSGKRKEILRITYDGTEKLNLNGKKIETRKVVFTFTSGEGKTTSKPIRAWLSIGKNSVPLKLEGELPIGKIQCIYTGTDL